MADKDLDVVLFGATGFTGRQAALYLGRHAPPGLRWAVAGRSKAKLEALQAEVRAPEVVVADSADVPAVRAMVGRARVVASTAGPFARYSDPVVDACVAEGADYADITGEIGWVRRLIERHHDVAAAKGLRIVPFCGFDSVPSDLGAFAVASWIRKEWDQDTRRVSASFKLRGGLNGGTLATMLDGAETGDLNLRTDPLLLNPPGHRSEAERARSADVRGARYDPDRRTFLAPFFMAAINTRVVRRSNALLAERGQGYGPDFSYEETAEHRTRWGARAVDLGLLVTERATGFGTVRRALRRLGPKPGEGPSEATMEHGFMRVRLVGEAADGRKVLATMQAQGDPGNRITTLILMEAALALATQREALPQAAGILTPASAIGQVLLDRILAAGVRMEIAPLGTGG
ncbi:MAG TPA: saccharopine dehydrogenase NADP-binding domain-containing protein [Myxococcales bacterium]|jgi:short subunit dehydrogenase-like uncharacterized protein